MECQGWSIQSNVKSVSFLTSHWFVCNECQIVVLCILETWTVRSICGRIYCKLGFAPILRISPVYSHGSLFTKNLRWWGYRAFHCPYVAYLNLFWFLIKHVGGPAALLQGNQENADESFSGGTNLPVHGHFIGVQSVRQSLAECGISTEVADVILSSWRKSTVKQYNVYLKKSSTFSLSSKSHFMRAPISMLLDFLHDLYTKGYGYSSQNTAGSAISALIRRISARI